MTRITYVVTLVLAAEAWAAARSGVPRGILISAGLLGDARGGGGGVKEKSDVYLWIIIYKNDEP